MPASSIRCEIFCLGTLLDQRNFLFGQVVKLVNEAVDLAVGGGDLGFDLFESVRVTLPGFLLLQVEHLLDEGHHLVVFRHVGGVLEVDGADGVVEN